MPNMETQEANNGPALRETDWQARQKIVGALEAYVDRVADLLGDNEDFDRLYVEERIKNVLDDVIADLRQGIIDMAVRGARVKQ